jgi:hypothetical protein
MYHRILTMTIPVCSLLLYSSILFQFNIDNEVEAVAAASKPAAKKPVAAPVPTTDRRILRKFH